MGQPVEQGGGHLGIAEDRRPFAEAEIGSDDDACALVELAEQMEEQRAPRGTEWQVTQLIEDHEVLPHQHLCELAGLSPRLFLLKHIDQFNGREEPDLSTAMLDGLDAER